MFYTHTIIYDRKCVKLWLRDDRISGFGWIFGKLPKGGGGGGGSKILHPCMTTGHGSVRSNFHRRHCMWTLPGFGRVPRQWQACPMICFWSSHHCHDHLRPWHLLLQHCLEMKQISPKTEIWYSDRRWIGWIGTMGHLWTAWLLECQVLSPSLPQVLMLLTKNFCFSQIDK